MSVTLDIDGTQLNHGVELLRPGADLSINGLNRQVLVPAGGSISVKYPLRINDLGEVPIRVHAFTIDGSAANAIERKVFVRVCKLL